MDELTLRVVVKQAKRCLTNTHGEAPQEIYGAAYKTESADESRDVAIKEGHLQAVKASQPMTVRQLLWLVSLGNQKDGAESTKSMSLWRSRGSGEIAIQLAGGCKLGGPRKPSTNSSLASIGEVGGILSSLPVGGKPLCYGEIWWRRRLAGVLWDVAGMDVP